MAFSLKAVQKNQMLFFNSHYFFVKERENILN